jgi:hypothetical protein
MKYMYVCPRNTTPESPHCTIFSLKLFNGRSTTKSDRTRRKTSNCKDFR